MNVRFFVQRASSRARYLAIALPLFALLSTIHAGCSSSRGGYYGNYGKPGSSGDKYSAPTDCTTYNTYSTYGGYSSYTNCDDDGFGP